MIIENKETDIGIDYKFHPPRTASGSNRRGPIRLSTVSCSFALLSSAGTTRWLSDRRREDLWEGFNAGPLQSGFEFWRWEET